jgi:hypothetical protein
MRVDEQSAHDTANEFAADALRGNALKRVSTRFPYQASNSFEAAKSFPRAVRRESIFPAETIANRHSGCPNKALGHDG